MSKTISTKINAISLSIVLVVGTIIVLFSSFMAGVVYAAVPEYGKYYNNNKDNDFLKNINCDNINTNLNGLNSDTTQGSIDNSITGLATEGTEDETSNINDEAVNANSFGNGIEKNNGSFDKDFEVFCNNLNTNKGGVTGPQGQQGERGLPGPNQISSNNLYFREGNSMTTGNALATITSTATCDSGDIVLEGGHNINNFGGGHSLF